MSLLRTFVLSARMYGGVFAPHPPKTKGEKRVYFVLALITGFTLILLGVFYILNPRSIVGDSLVNSPNGNPEEFPPPTLFPFYVKPVTIFFVASVVFAYCFFALIGPSVESKIPRGVRALLLVVSLAVFAMGIYEVLFNFALWASILVTNPNPDLGVNSFPTSKWETNLVFATKSYVSLVFISFFAFATFSRSLFEE